MPGVVMRFQPTNRLTSTTASTAIGFDNRRISPILVGPIHQIFQQEQFATTTKLRGHPLNLRTQQARLDVRKFSFSVRVVKPWNALPADVVMPPSIQSFKKNLDIFVF
ncbi:hypothetical protein SprV_0501824300 [Sparganum proliferum]